MDAWRIWHHRFTEKGLAFSSTGRQIATRCFSWLIRERSLYSALFYWSGRTSKGFPAVTGLRARSVLGPPFLCTRFTGTRLRRSRRESPLPCSHRLTNLVGLQVVSSLRSCVKLLDCHCLLRHWNLWLPCTLWTYRELINYSSDHESAIIWPLLLSWSKGLNICLHNLGYPGNCFIFS